MSELSPTLSQQLAFLKELEKLKAIQRKTTVKPDNNRQENSAKHSWHIAVQAMTLQEYAEEPVDISRVIHMLLLHDIVEIDAGDTFAFANSSQLSGQEAKELAAAERLFGLLPSAQADAFKALWLDCDGGTWAKYQVSRSQVLQRNRHLEKMAPRLWDYLLEQINISVQHGWLQDI